MLSHIPTRHRNTAIAGGVVLLHVAALWAMQTGLLRRAVEIVVPVEVLAQLIDPPKPPAPPPVEPPKPVPPKREVVHQPKLQPPPMPVAIPDPTPAPNAPTGSVEPQPPAPPIAAPVAPAPAPVAPPAPIQPPLIDADFAANEDLYRPPAISRRLGESGKVVVRITVGTNGFATRARVLKSSGFERLDQAAVAGALRQKFIPAKRGGVPVEADYDLPVNYERTQ